MENTKSKWLSKGLWGGIMMALGVVLGFFGYTLSPEDQTLVVDTVPEFIETGLYVFGSIMAIYGRLTAKHELT